MLTAIMSSSSSSSNLSDQDALKDANKVDLDFIAAFSAADKPKDGYVFGSASRGVGYYSLDEGSDCLVDACRILQELLVMNIKHHAANLASMQTKKCTCFGKKLTREEKMEYDYLTGKVHEMERMVEHLRVAIQSGNAPIGTAKSEPWWTCYTALACDARELGNATNVKVVGAMVIASSKVPKPILKTPSSPPKANRPMTTRPPVSSPPRKKTTFSTTRSSSTNMFPYLDSGDSLVPVHCGTTTHCHTSSWGSSGGGGGHHSCSGGGGGNCGGGGGSSGGGGGGCGGGGGGCGGC